MFLIKDCDNDSCLGNCVVRYNGGWWFNCCVYFNLNGYYYYGFYKLDYDGVNWCIWKGGSYFVKWVEMKIRFVDFS